MTAKFSESWVYGILEAAGEKGVAAHAMEKFYQGERTDRAEYWQQNPIRRVSDERLYRRDSDDDDEGEGNDATPGGARKALAIVVLLSVLSISLKSFQSALTSAQDSISQDSPVNLPARNPIPLSCYRTLHSVLPPIDTTVYPKEPKYYASANECAVPLVP